MRKIIDFLKRNIAIHIGIGIWLGVMGAVYVIYSNAEVSSGLNASSVNIDTTNMPLVGENKKLDEVLDYLYEKAAQVGACPDGAICYMPYERGYYLPAAANATTSSLNVGDLVYMVPTETEVQLDGQKTGFLSGTYISSSVAYDTNPTYINPSELKYWRVIRKNANGTVEVVSEYVSSVGVTFDGVKGYSNAVGYLNELASHYENSKYTLETNGSRYMGYNNQIEYLTNTYYFGGSYSGKYAPWRDTSNNRCETGTCTGSGGREVDGYGDTGIQAIRQT